ncbi:hypothetical protein [Glaciihabitans sp. UYNi722]|uniref:hypothetical protein n=1 Tax=Glaciihabitans sp. UYNi722 TaxID=3156344 RepID=UPI003390A0C7
MKSVNIELTNCHGIHRLSTVLPFAKSNAAAIYAPNGMMKTSFARTFADLCHGIESNDHMFPDRTSTRVINDDRGTPIAGEDVVVIVSYDEDMGPTEATSTLLVDKVLRTEYEALEATIHAAKAELIAALKTQATTRKNVERVISLAFTSDGESFFKALLRIENELETDNAEFADLSYDVVFDDKVVALLRTLEFRSALSDYVARFNELLDISTYFNRKTFNYYNAATITKSLGDNGFFTAKHSILLNAAGSSEQISTQKELTALIDAEKKSISDDEGLRKTFSELEKQLNKNMEARKFYEYIASHIELLPELENVDGFNEKVWTSYIKANEALYQNVLKQYRDAASRKKAIEEEAAKQSGQWEEVIKIFNDRFFVPFTLTIKNKTRVVLGQESIPQLGFEFNDGDDHAPVERSDLLQVLSTGEKKALYILNVLFEVQRRKGSAGETLFIVDDIADSFDYKNKYAIIQYLKDISEVGNFRLVMLTHNFDFFRTLESRFVPYNQCFMASRNDDGVGLAPAAGIKNPFINDLKPHFFDDLMKRIASIPFMRNLLEYTRGDSDPDYLKLTSLLHWKDDTATLTQADLDIAFSNLFGGSVGWLTPSELVLDAIHKCADHCVAADTSINFENKILLSMAIRLLAEKFMATQINDPTFVAGLNSSQTGKLFSRFKKDFPAKVHAIHILEKVVLMTPEQIHVNSFMYEPILDMSDDHLRRLLGDVKTLSS